MSLRLPRTDITEKEKKANNYMWFREFMEYACMGYYNKRKRLVKLNRLYDGYNGFINYQQYIHLNKPYGNDNTTKYVDYRLMRTKVELIRGEQLALPINATVMTINPEAKTRKLDSISTIIGMHHCQEQIEKLRGIGVNVFDGMQPPQPAEGETIFDQLPEKEKNEVIMQYMVNDFIKRSDIKTKANENMFDAVIASECFSRTFINAQNKVEHETIDPRNAIFEESENDPFCKNSPYHGHRKLMFVHQIENAFSMTDSERTQLHNLSNLSNLLTYNVPGRQYYDITNGALMIEVVYLEWDGWKEIYEKSFITGFGEEETTIISNEYYDKNRSKIASDIRANRYNINIKYKQTKYECVKIGHGMYINTREKPNQPLDVNEAWKTDSDYNCCLINTVNGVRISLFQMTEHVDRIYNMVMYQIGRELVKAKGKIIVIDEAAVGATKTQVDTLYQITNDSVLWVNSAAEGNKGQRDLQTLAGIKEIDIGLSASVQTLINLKMELERTADSLTGILASRQGITPASMTSGNNQSSVEASRTTTGPLFYYHQRFMENFLNKAVDRLKIVWGHLTPEDGDNILGSENMEWLKATKDIAWDRFGTYISDSRQDAKIKETIRGYMPVAFQAKQLDFIGAIEFEMQQTTSEGLQKLKKIKADFERAQQAIAKQEQNAAAANMQIQEDGQNQRLQAAQGHEKEMAAAHGIINTTRDTVKQQNQAILEKVKAEHVNKK